jgi:hypothetical protein
MEIGLGLNMVFDKVRVNYNWHIPELCTIHRLKIGRKSVGAYLMICLYTVFNLELPDFRLMQYSQLENW